jgi:hypothetical protein
MRACQFDGIKKIRQLGTLTVEFKQYTTSKLTGMCVKVVYISKKKTLVVIDIK